MDSKGSGSLSEQRKNDFVWVERISLLLDNKFKIGGFSFGLDPLLNLIPFAGQIVSFGTSIVLVLVMLRNGVGSKVAIKMLLNIMYDAIFGSIPFVGQIFDFFNKANQKNIILLREHYFENKHQGSAKALLLTILIVLLISCSLLFYIMWALTSLLIQTISALF